MDENGGDCDVSTNTALASTVQGAFQGHTKLRVDPIQAGETLIRCAR